LRIAVACRNASGMPDMPVFTVSVTGEEYALGNHYDRAEALAEEAGYEKGPSSALTTRSTARSCWPLVR